MPSDRRNHYRPPQRPDMDKGYSNLLTEILPAIDIDYEDTADLQIVCPACREPIYKAVRKGSPAVHYLAHYEASRSAVAECELRVGSMGEATIATQNQDARRQTLEYFLAVFEEMLKETLERAYRPAHPATLMALGRHKTFAVFREIAKDAMLRKFSPATLARVAEASFGNKGRDVLTPKAKHLGARRQAVISADIMQTLLGGASKRNFNLLFNSAWAVAMEWAKPEERAELIDSLGITDEALDVLWRMPFTSRNKAIRMIQELEAQPFRNGDLGTTGLIIFIEMFMNDLLLATDYLGWLARRSERSQAALRQPATGTRH